MAYQDPFAPRSQAQSYSAPQSSVSFDAGLRSYMLRIYNYMASALALTGIVAYGVVSNQNLLSLFFSTDGAGHVGLSGLGMLILFAPIGLVLWLNLGLNRMSVTTAQAIFWAYAALMGVSLTPFLLFYTGASVAQAFFTTAGTFGAMSLYGYTTRRDLTGFGSFLFMGLIGLILASVVNMFTHSAGMSFALSVIGVLIFTGLIAFKTQMLKTVYYNVGSSEGLAKATIMGALSLYISFINLFINLLQIMGQRRN